MSLPSDWPACGDAVYNDVHLHLGESNTEGRKEWIAALDTIESLKPVAAIAGHKRPDAPDTPNNIEATRNYIRDFDRIASHTKTALDLYNEMLAIYPERVNPAVLWYSAQAVKPGNRIRRRSASLGGRVVEAQSLNKTKEDDFLATITTKNSTRIFDKRSSHGCEK